MVTMAQSNSSVPGNNTSAQTSPGQQYGLPALDTTIVLSGTLTDAYSVVDPINFSVRCQVCGIILHSRSLFQDHLHQKQHLDNYNYARAHPQQDPPNMPAEGFGPPVSRPTVQAPAQFAPLPQPRLPPRPPVRLPWQRPFMPRQPQHFRFPAQMYPRPHAPNVFFGGREMEAPPLNPHVAEAPYVASHVPSTATTALPLEESQSTLPSHDEPVLVTTEKSPSTLLNNYIGAAVIGVEYLLEVTGGENMSEYYICMMCSRWMPRRQEAIQHLCSPSHRLTYLDRYFPRAFERLGGGLNSGKQRWTTVTFSQLDTICERIEKRYGRFNVVLIAQTELYKHPLAVRKHLNQKEHYSEDDTMDYSDLPEPFSGCWLSSEETPTLTVGDVVLLTESTIKLCSKIDYVRGKKVILPESAQGESEKVPEQVRGEINRFRQRAKEEHTTTQKTNTSTATTKNNTDKKCDDAAMASASKKSSYFEAARQKAKLRGEVTSSDSDVEVLTPQGHFPSKYQSLQRRSQSKGSESIRRESDSLSGRAQAARYRNSHSESYMRRGGMASYSQFLTGRRPQRPRYHRAGFSRSPSSEYSSDSGGRHMHSRYRSRHSSDGEWEGPGSSGRRSPRRPSSPGFSGRRSPRRPSSPGSSGRRSPRRPSSPGSSGRRSPRRPSSPGDGETVSDRLKRFSHREQVMLDRLQMQKQVFDRRPEDHPHYKQQWCSFWERRHAEVTRQGLDPDSYDYIPEWKVYWQDYMEQRFACERSQRREELMRFYRLVEVGGRLVDEKEVNPVEEQQSLSSSSLVTVITADKEANAEKTCKAADKEVNTGKTYKAADNPSLPADDPSPPSAYRSDPAVDSMPDLASVLRMLAALEDQLGSFAGATNSLLSRTVAAERRAAGSSQHLLQVPEHALLLETVRAKLEGQLSAGVLTVTETASRKALDLLTRLLQQVPAHVFSAPISVAQIVEQVSGLTPDLLSRDSLSISRHIACELSRLDQTGISDDDLTKVLVILLKPKIVTRNGSDHKASISGSDTHSVKEVGVDVEPNSEIPRVTPLFNAYSGRPIQRSSASSKSHVPYLDQGFDYDSYSEGEDTDIVCLDSAVDGTVDPAKKEKPTFPIVDTPVCASDHLIRSNSSSKVTEVYDSQHRASRFPAEENSNKAWEGHHNPPRATLSSTSAAMEAQWTAPEVDSHTLASTTSASSEPDDELSVEQIYSLLQNFDSLSRAEQEKLMEYLRNLEVNKSEKVGQLKALLNRKPIRSLISEKNNESSDGNSTDVGKKFSYEEYSRDKSVNKDFGVPSVTASSNVLMNKEKSTLPSGQNSAIPFDLSLISKEAVDAALNLAEQLKYGSGKPHTRSSSSGVASVRTVPSSHQSEPSGVQSRYQDTARRAGSSSTDKLESSSPQPMDLESDEETADNTTSQSHSINHPSSSDSVRGSERSVSSSQFQLPPGFKPIGGGNYDDSRGSGDSTRFRQSEFSGSRGTVPGTSVRRQDSDDRYSEWSHNKGHEDQHGKWSHGPGSHHDEWSHGQGGHHGESNHQGHEAHYTRAREDHRGQGREDHRGQVPDGHAENFRGRNNERSHVQPYRSDQGEYSHSQQYEDHHSEWSHTQHHEGHRNKSSQSQGKHWDSSKQGDNHAEWSHPQKDTDDQTELYRSRRHDEFQHGSNQSEDQHLKLRSENWDRNRQDAEKRSRYDASSSGSGRGRGDGVTPRGANWRGRGPRSHYPSGRGHGPPPSSDPNSTVKFKISTRGYRGRGGSVRGAGGSVRGAGGSLADSAGDESSNSQDQHPSWRFNPFNT